MTHERFNRILNWTTDDEQRTAYDFLAPKCPVPWPVAMLAQRLHWQGRTQEAYDMAARLS